MKLGSLFDGSGGFPLAGSLCGIEPVWASEIEPYPIAVTRSRFPNMKHFGDISKINGAEVEPVDIITFGSPCQDLSVAGKRAGLKHEANGDEETTRSGLFMEAVRIIKEMREATNGIYPRFALWENVPGAFSSNKGEDFRIVLEELIKIVEPTAVMPTVPKGGWAYADSYFGDGWSLSYRVFDAQYWGVPQRRRRIHLVADFRGQCAHEVLFEREGVRGDFAEGRTPWQGTAAYAEGSLGADDRARDSVIGSFQNTGIGWWNESPIGATVRTPEGGDSMLANVICVATQQGGAEVSENGICPTVTAAAGMSGNNQPWICKPAPNLLLDDQGGQQISVRTDGKAPTLRAEMHGNVPCVVESGGFCPEQSAKTRGIGWEEEMAPTLRAGVVPGVVSALTLEPGIAAREGGHIYEGVCGTLRANAGDNQMAVAYSFDSLSSNSMKSANPHSGCREVEVAKCLDTTNPNPGKNQGGIAVVQAVKTWDARGNGDGDTVSTLTGDHENRITDYTSVVVEEPPVYCLQGNGIDRADTAGCNGKGWKEDVCYTLNTIDRPAVCCLETFHCVTEEEITQPLKARDYKDPLVVAIDRAAFNQGQNAQYEPQFYTDGTVSTLVARGPSAVCYWDGSQTCGTLTANNAGGNQRMPDKENFNCVLQMASGKPVTGCLMASGYDKLGAQEMFSGDYTVVENSCVRYIVRRLTPTECARLQGFPDKWGHIGTKDDLTDEEWTFWAGVRNTHAAINGRVTKNYTKAQMLTWYNKLHTDSAEYKMWGNGIALPPALYCMQGIAEVLNESSRCKCSHPFEGVQPSADKTAV